MKPDDLKKYVPEELHEELADMLQRHAELARKLQCATSRAITAQWLKWDELEEAHGPNWHYNYGHVTMRVEGEEIDAIPYQPYNPKK